MTPPAAGAAARRTSHAAAAPRRASGPRRVSGPTRAQARGGTVRRGAAATPRPVVFRLAAAVHAVAEHRFLDRLVRGRGWIAILGLGLIGIVFMQVSMLRMNAGIGQAVERATALERENAAMQAEISGLSSGERIAAEGAKAGLVDPGNLTARFLDARQTNLARAVAGITPPSATPTVSLPSATLGGTSVAAADANSAAGTQPAAASGQQTAPAPGQQVVQTQPVAAGGPTASAATATQQTATPAQQSGAQTGAVQQSSTQQAPPQQQDAASGAAAAAGAGTTAGAAVQTQQSASGGVAAPGTGG